MIFLGILSKIIIVIELTLLGERKFNPILHRASVLLECRGKRSHKRRRLYPSFSKFVKKAD